MEWLSKAGDLLDKLDKQAAEKLEHVGFETVTPPGEDDLLNILNGDEDDDVVEAKAAVGVGEEGKGETTSPEEGMRREILRLEGLVRKKTDQIEQLVASHRTSIKANADRDKKCASEVEKAQAEVTTAKAAKRAAEKAKEQAEQQVEAMRSAVRGQAAELEALRKEAGNQSSEKEVLNEEIVRLEGEVKRQAELHASLQQRYDAAMAKATAADASVRSEFLSFQEREESLSSDTVHFTRELAAAERKRQEAETSLREQQGRLRAAEESAEEAEARAGELTRKCDALQREAAQLRAQLAEGGKEEEGRRERLEAEARESKKKMEEAQMQLRQLERIHASASATPYQRPAQQDSDLQAQLSKMCEEVLAKQAVLEGLMGEKVALRSRLDAEANKNHELSAQLSKWQAAVRNVDLEAGVGVGDPPKMSIADALTALGRSRDVAAALWALDDLLRVTAGHIAADTTIRAMAGVYLVILQLSALIVLVHALLGRHH